MYIENARHEINNDNPEKLSEIINDFWQKINQERREKKCTN